MALKAYPLNDTDYTAEDAQLYTATRTSGVYADDHFNISVTGMDNDVTIKPGIGWMKLGTFQGIAVASTEDVTINAGVPDSMLPRIDAVVYAYDANANKPEIIIKQGEKGTTPTPPAVVRDDFRHELHLYHIRRRPGATAITPGDITDLRMDSNYCGLMADSITQVDMTAINAQINEFISDWESQIANVTDGKMIESPEYPGCYYRMNRGVKEWLNPPMMEDVEYATTKRQDGKRVYTKLLKARSQAGSVSLPDIERIVSVFAVAERDWNGEKIMFQLPVDFLPKDSPTIQKMQIYYQGNTIVFQSVVAKGMYNLYITVEYTKPGDEVAYTNVTADGDTLNVETNGDVSAQGDNLNIEMFTTVSADGGAYIRNLTINGTQYKFAVNQSGAGAPTNSTPGIVGLLYMATDTGIMYKCVSADGDEYKWEPLIDIPGLARQLAAVYTWEQWDAAPNTGIREELADVMVLTLPRDEASTTYYAADAAELVDGEWKLIDPEEYDFDGNVTAVVGFRLNAVGRYIQTNQGFFHIPEGADVSNLPDDLSDFNIFCSSVARLSIASRQGIVSSDNPSAHPDEGEQDGFWYIASRQRGEERHGLPTVTDADNGKILRVVDGAWMASVIAQAEEASF